MKKRLTNILTLLFLIVIFPMVVFAEPREYIPIKDSVSKTVDKLEVKSLHFVDNTGLPSNNFGLVGEVTNTKDYNVILKAKINYYNEEKVLLYSLIEEFELDAKSENTIFSMKDSKMNSKYEISDIAYYSVDFETRKGTIPKETYSARNEEYCLNKKYTVDYYEVSIDVKEDNTYEIKESFTAYYNENSLNKTIKRVIPSRRTIKNRNDSKSVFNIKTLDVTADHEFMKSFGLGQGTFIRLQEENEDYEKSNYTLDYEYIVKSKSKDDEFFYTIDPKEWDACLGNISFSIHMPNDFDVSKIEFVNDEGKDNTQKVIIQKHGNTLTGTYKDILKDDSLNIGIYLGKNYFKRKNISIGKFLIFVIPLGLVIISTILWFFFGKDRPVKEKINGKVPKNKNVLELSMAYKETLSKSDIINLIVNLCEEGYIRLLKTGKRHSLSGLTNYEIIKIKEYSGNIEEEKRLMEDIFESSLANTTEAMLKKNYTKGKASKKLSDLRGISVNTKYLEGMLSNSVEIILEKSQEKYYDKIFEKSATILSRIINTFGYIIAAIILIIPTLEYGTLEDALIISVLLFISILSIKEGIINSSHSTTKIGSMILIILSILVSRVTPLWETIVYEKIFVLGILFGLAMVVLNRILVDIMPKKTEYGAKVTEEINNLRLYLKGISKEELKKKTDENPDYFPSIIPYVYILGLDKYIFRLAEELKLTPPIWLDNTKIQDLKYLKKDLEMIINKKS